MTTSARKHKSGFEPFSDPDTLVWSPGQVCKILDCGMTTLDHMIARGEFPEPFRVGKKLRRWRRDTVIQWIREQDATTLSVGRPRSSDQ